MKRPWILGTVALGCLAGCSETREWNWENPPAAATRFVEQATAEDIAALRSQIAVLSGRLEAQAVVVEELQSRLQAKLRAAAQGGADSAATAERLPPRLQMPKDEPAPPPYEPWVEGAKVLAAKLEERLLEADPKPAPAADDARVEPYLGHALPLQRFLDASGNVLDLSDYLGKKKIVLVVLRGFSGQICLHCSVQTRALAKSVADFAAADAEIALLYPGPASSVPQFLKAVQDLGDNVKLPFPILLDIDQSFVRAMKIEDALAKPSSFVLDKEGVIRYVYIGKDIGDRPAVKELLKAAADLP